jgi:hypothetical protein
MKQLLVILFLSLSLASFGQAKKDSVQITDSTRLLSISDLKEFDQKLQEMFTVKQATQYQEIVMWLQRRLAARIEEVQKEKIKIIK